MVASLELTPVSCKPLEDVLTSPESTTTDLAVECAILGKGQTVHSSGQMEPHRNLVHDKSMKVGGLQCIITVDECVIPLQVTNGLPCMKMRPHADEAWERTPKTELTSENEWKPACLDGGIEDMDKWAETLKILQNDERWDMKDHPFDEMG